MTRKRRGRSHGTLAVLDEEVAHDDAGRTEVRDEVGLFASDYGRFVRSRSDVPPPLLFAEDAPVVERRR